MKKLNIFAGIMLAFASLALVASAETYQDDTLGGYAMPGYAERTYTLKATVDLSVQGVTTNDVIQALAIPSNSFVRGVFYQVYKGAATNINDLTFGIGDGTSATGYVGAVVGKTAAGWSAWSRFTEGSSPLSSGTVYRLSGGQYAQGKLYTSNDTVDLKFDGYATDGVIRVKAVVDDLND